MRRCASYARPVQRALRMSIALLAATVRLWAFAAAAAPAQTTITASPKLPPPNPLSPEIFPVTNLDKRPPSFPTSARQAIRAAERTKAVQDARRKHPHLVPRAYISPLRLRAG